MSNKKFPDGWQHFLKLCCKIKNRQQLQEVLSFFLTPKEQESIATRIKIIQELLAGKKTQREIAKTYKVSIAKITRGSNNLKMMDTKTKNLLVRNLAK